MRIPGEIAEFQKKQKNFAKNTCKVMYLDVHYTSYYRI